jgi:acylphosphatase
MIAKRFLFEGHVQGVGFRATTKHVAKGYDVTGWVRNLADGRVEVRAQASDEQEVMEFLKGILESVLNGHIKNHTVEDLPVVPGEKSFLVQH